MINPTRMVSSKASARSWRGFFFAPSLILAACGGGSSDGGGAVVQTGVLIDGPVRGVHYQTATQSGLTDADGRFRYLANETVAFSIGGVQLGSAKAASQLDPFDLAGIAPPSTEAELRAALRDTSFTAFDRAINIARLLVSLDNDHNPDNGLDLSGWDTALAGASLDFDADWRDFHDRVFNQFAHAHQVNTSVSSTVLLTHLYSSLSIAVTGSVLTRSETNVSAGATLDATIDAATDYTYEFDNTGHVLKVTQAVDSNADGAADSRSVTGYTYDAAGQMSTKTQGPDADGDGVVDDMGKTTHTYDAGGNLLSTVARIYGPFNSVMTDSRTYTYATNGDLTTQFEDWEIVSSNSVYSQFVSTGAHPLGILMNYSYDAAGNQVAEALQYTSCGLTLPASCTTFEHTNTSTYDAKGHLLTAEKFQSFSSSGGLVTYVETYSYDANGTLLGSVTPTPFTPDPNNPINTLVLDTTTTYAYDAKGKLKSKVVEIPYLGKQTTITYDDSGNELSQIIEQDSDKDGTVDSRDTYAYAYDANGNRLTELHQSDINADGVIDSSTQIRNSYAQINNALTYLLQEFGEQL